jgi:starch synthase
MDQQKGIDLAIDALRAMSSQNWQAVILGSGDARLEASALNLQEELPDKVRARVVFDPQLSHRLYAGADILLMPSRYEPCGLSQLIALRYGTVPVARATGGLKDTVIDYTGNAHGNGFTYTEASSAATARSLSAALAHYQQKTAWKEIMTNGMKQDFSWAISAKKYCTLYQELLDVRSREEK